MEEMLDTYTKDGKYLGVKSKLFCHSDNPGVYHKPVFLWIINKDNKILVQKRSKYKKFCPNIWDTSCAGHVNAKEDPADACIRETYEELGIKLNKKNLEFIFEYIFDWTMEIARVYLIRLNRKVNFMLDEKEVEEVKWLDIDSFKCLFFSDEFATHELEYKNKIFEILKEKVGGSMEEMFDTYTKDGKYLGIKSKSFCHSDNPGVYHKPVWIWIVNYKNKILIQKRAMCKKVFPGKWDMPSAGHVHAGESSIDACVRETNEELGIMIDKSRFEFVGESIYEEGYEIGQVYFLYLDKDYEFKLEESEVEEVKWVSLDEFKSIWNTDLFLPHDKDYKDMVIHLLESKIKNKTQE